MRLGGPVMAAFSGPDEWVAAIRERGYGAAYCPVDASADDATVKAYEEAAKAANIAIAEVGAWSNPLSRDEKTRKDAVAHCQAQLALAERIGARCCVNIAGSRGEQWDGPHPDNLTADTFDMIVYTVRTIVDAVKPRRTFYSLETMPWMYPDSTDSYLRLIEAIDRPGFAVHMDPANLICSPQRYFANAALMRDAFARLGRHVRSCHGKDVRLATHMTTHIDEVRPGLGGLDYRAFLRELNKLDPDTPLMLEHLPDELEYRAAADYVRGVATAEGLTWVG